MATARVKNWSDFQHYKNRCPPWIKLQKDLLDNYEFACLPIASKALAPLLWLLASESMEGEVRIDPEWLAFRLRFSVDDVGAGLTPLIEKGFLVVASGVLAPCLQSACLEGEGETEEEREPRASKPKKVSKAGGVTLREWSLDLGDEDAVPVADPIFAWAEAQGIQPDWIALAWFAFENRYADDSKTYTDWRAVFRRALRDDWLKLWRMGRNGWELTTAGIQAQREMGQ
jgi:hypothetical protein